MIPARTLDALERYATWHVRPGDFLLAVLRNDLLAAVTRADAENLAALRDIVLHVYWELPGPCWGTRAKVLDWLAQRPARAALAQALQEAE